MITTLRNAWKVEDIRKKMIFTLFVLVVFRLGSAIPVPYINKEGLAMAMSQMGGTVIDFLNLMSGGNLGSFSIFALSVYPYITASIIVQLLTVAIPQLEELSKEGEEGRKKIQQLTKLGGVILGVFQAIATFQGLLGYSLIQNGWLQGITIISVLLAGSMFLVWLGEQITEFGIGNGISMIIFAGIISGLIDQIISWGQGLFLFAKGEAGSINPIAAILMIIIVLVIVAFVVAISEGERKIPVQYAKRVVGRKMYGGQSTHIPIKVNMGGVMPVIFASSILAVPSTIGILVGGGFREWVSRWLSPTQGQPGFWIHMFLSVALIILFAFFYTTMQFNTVEYAKNLQQHGGFIPGIRPGRPTSDYLARIANRITIIGAIALAFLSILPSVLSAIFKLNISFGGTAVLIVVGVVLETIRQLEAMLQMRHYKGFLNK